MTLRNTGKLGFKFSILQEDDEGADEETGVQKMALDMDEQQPDARQQKDNEQNDKGQEVIPGRPMVIPSMVSSSWHCFRYRRVIYCEQVFFHLFFVCVSGLCCWWCRAISAYALHPGNPWGV